MQVKLNLCSWSSIIYFIVSPINLVARNFCGKFWGSDQRYTWICQLDICLHGMRDIRGWNYGARTSKMALWITELTHRWQFLHIRDMSADGSKQMFISQHPVFSLRPTDCLCSGWNSVSSTSITFQKFRMQESLPMFLAFCDYPEELVIHSLPLLERSASPRCN